MHYREDKIVYFRYPGKHNTATTLALAFERGKNLSIGKVVLASSTGSTAKLALNMKNEIGYHGELIVVGLHQGFNRPGIQEMSPEILRELKLHNINVFFGTHSLSSVSRSFRYRWGGVDLLEVLAEGFRRFSRGIKVGIEITLMTCDAGLILPNKDVIAVGGSGNGVDSAIVINPGSSNSFFDLKVREIICLPCYREIELFKDVIELDDKGLTTVEIAERIKVSHEMVIKVIGEFRKIKELYLTGHSSHEISQKLKIGESTVDMYLECIKLVHS